MNGVKAQHYAIVHGIGIGNKRSSAWDWGRFKPKHMTFISVYVSGYANTGHSKYINKLSDKTIFCNLNIVTLSGLDVGIIRSLIKLGDLN